MTERYLRELPVDPILAKEWAVDTGKIQIPQVSRELLT